MSSSNVNMEAVFSKPCNACRKRKVRCDKLRPCSNCSRSKQSCTYDTGSNGQHTSDDITRSSSGDEELRERLARLEKLMATMTVGEGAAKVSARNSLKTTNETLNNPTINTQETQYQQPSFTDISSSSLTLLATVPVGQIVFQEGEGAYFDADFWPGLICEIEELRCVFDAHQAEGEPSQWTSLSMLGVPSIFSSADLSASHPSLDESNMLLKLFFEAVNPFIRVLHQLLFMRELGQYRRGKYAFRNEFEALLISIYVLTINSLRSELVQQVFFVSKDTLLARYQYAAQISLAKMEFFKTQRIPGIWALLHYLTFLFQLNLYKDAVAMLGIAARQAQAIGLHRDPSHFPYSPWVCELRRRIWNHICYLDGLAISSYGAESCLPASSDSVPPGNANDGDWHASRFAKPASVPSNILGFKDMSCVLTQRQVSDTVRALAKLEPNDFTGKEKILDETEGILNAKYFRSGIIEHPAYAVATALVDIRLSSLRLLVKHRQSEAGKCKSQLPNPEKHKVFVKALKLLESYDNHAKNFATYNWEWVFETDIPWLAIAILIVEAPNLYEQHEKGQAQSQIDRIFARNGVGPVSNTQMWKMLVELRARIGGDPATAQAARPSTAGVSFEDDYMLDLGNDGGFQGDFTFNEQLAMEHMPELSW